MATMYLSIERFQLTSSWKASYLDDKIGGELTFTYPTEKQAIKVFNASAIPAGSVIQQAILTVSAAEGKGGGYLRMNGSTALSQDVTHLFKASQEGKYADFGITFSYRAYGDFGNLGANTSTAVIRSATIAVTYVAGAGEAFDADAYRTAALAPSRDIRPRGIVTYPDGSTQPIDGRHILRFDINEGYDNGILLGTAAGAVLEMNLANAGGEWLPGGSMRGNRPIYGAKITMEIGLKVNGEYVYTPAGTYIIDHVRGNEGDPAISLQGYDEMCNSLETPFTDGLRYPATLSQILQEIVTQSGMGVFGVLACNRVAQIPKAPDWGEECTLRRALAFVCAAGGSYAYITRDGLIGIADAWKQSPAIELATEHYTKLAQDERIFSFNRIVVNPRNAKKETDKIHASLNSDLEELPSNTLYIDDNPLFVKGQTVATTMANGLRDALQGASWQALDVRWRGDPSVTFGTRVKLTDRRGNVIHSTVMAQTMGWNNGFYSSSRCKINTKEIAKTALTGGGMINTKKIAVESILGTYLVNGAITEEKLSDGSIKKAHIQQATIDELNTEAFTAVSAEIERLAAGEVTTDKLYAALATIASAQITAANIDKANIQWAEIASLSAKIAEIAKAQITTANINEANIQWANIASLSASIAQIVTAKIQTADIDFAHIKDLAADTAIITKGVGGELYISRLAVTEANMVSLSVGQLLVKGQDGGFYAVTVDESGNITTEKKQVGNGDVQNLSINAGEKLIEGSVIAATLNAKDIFADSAIIRSLIAANLDVDTLFAREATISKLNAVDISGNEYLKLSVKKAVDNIEIGGRNLLLDSGREVSNNVYLTAGYMPSSPLIPGETYTVSICVTPGTGLSVIRPLVCYGRIWLAELSPSGTKKQIIQKTFVMKEYLEGFTPDVNAEYARVDFYRYPNDGTVTSNTTIHWVKIEKGNKATDWTAAPEDLESRVLNAETAITLNSEEIGLRAKKTEVDKLTGRITDAEAQIVTQAGEIQIAVTEVSNISVGGRNLLLDSGTEVSNNKYNAATYTPIEPMEIGETYTLSVCVTPGTGLSNLTSYVSQGMGGTTVYFPVSGTEKQVISRTFLMERYQPGYTPEDNIRNADITFYRYPNDGSVTGNTTIHWAKLEKGNKATDWTPAPEDPVQTLKNTAMTLNGDGIEMNTTGYFRLYANDGKNSRIKLGGDNVTANFSVDESGMLGAISGDFAQGLSVGNQPVWTRGNIIISSSQPTGVHDVLWIQPMQGVQQTSHSYLNTSQDHFTGGNAMNFTLAPDSASVLSSGGSYSYSLSLRMTLGQDTTTVKDFTISAVLSTGAGSVTLTGQSVSLTGWKNVNLTLTGTSGVNLCASSGNITAAVTVSGNVGNTYMYIPRNTSLILTSKNTAASSAGAQTCTIHYIQ